MKLTSPPYVFNYLFYSYLLNYFDFFRSFLHLSSPQHINKLTTLISFIVLLTFTISFSF